MRSRIDREARTVEAMIRMYCQGVHGRKAPDQEANAKPVCPECRGLLAYAEKRIRKCPFREEKPVCARCPVHCYRPEMRARIKEVMRYAGPRMIYRHPILALLHFRDSFRHGPLP